MRSRIVHVLHNVDVPLGYSTEVHLEDGRRFRCNSLNFEVGKIVEYNLPSDRVLVGEENSMAIEVAVKWTEA